MVLGLTWCIISNSYYTNRIVIELLGIFVQKGRVRSGTSVLNNIIQVY